MNATTASNLLTLSRMARQLGVPQRWLRDEANCDRVPCLRAGNRYLFNPQAVIDSLAVRAARRAAGDPLFAMPDALQATEMEAATR